jgi:hypothetical protein
MAALETPSALWRSAIVDRERLSVTVHKETLRGSDLPPPNAVRPRTFVHGFLLPFSLILATLRHPTLGIAYLRIFVVRMLIVGVLAAIAFCFPKELGRPGYAPTEKDKSSGIYIGKKPKRAGIPVVGKPGRGLTITFTPDDDKSDKSEESEKSEKSDEAEDADADADVGDEAARVEKSKKQLLKETHNSPIAKAVVDAADAAQKAEEEKKRKEAAEPAIVRTLQRDWKWVAWFLGVIAAMEAVVVFFSRKWDDWLSFFASTVARIRPEDAAPKAPGLSVDIPWSLKKLKRRLRGYVLFSTGLPLLWLFELVPSIGHVLFGVGVTVWGWYWLAVFTAAKSAHAWADDGIAPSPLLIRELRARTEGGHRLLRPVALYARVWARITRSVNAAASTFERNPAPFLGLALARAVLSLPGLYLLARPIVPVAAGRLCAETDPQDRFSL